MKNLFTRYFDGYNGLQTFVNTILRNVCNEFSLLVLLSLHFGGIPFVKGSYLLVVFGYIDLDLDFKLIDLEYLDSKFINY